MAVTKKSQMKRKKPSKTELAQIVQLINSDSEANQALEDERKEKEKLSTERLKLRNAMRRDLLHQLKENRVMGRHYTDLVDDYLKLYDIKNMLIDDIEERGVKVEYRNGEFQFGYKKNDSVTELTRVNNQMLKVLADLGLKAAEIENFEDDEDL